jgi:alpha-tubulin suppressor-like RCC1 family protein
MVKKIRLFASFIIALSVVVFAQEQGVIIPWGIDDGSTKDEGQVTDTPNNPNDNDFTAVDAGYYHSIALRADGSVVAWGGNINDQSPPETTNQVADTPVSNDFIAIAAGKYHNVVIKSDHSLVAWGEDYYGQSTPPGGNDYIAVAAGYAHSLALKSNGTLSAWGVNHGDPYDYDYGQVSGTPTDSNFIAVAAGEYHSLAIAADAGATAGTIRTWGYDRDNVDLGDGYYVNYDLQAPPDGNDFVAVAAGDLHCVALRADGSLIAWGANSNYWSKVTREIYGDYGQVTDTPAGNDFVAIAAGSHHNVAMKADGTVVCWGRNDKGQAPDPTSTDSDFVAIAAGDFHSLAVELNCLYLLQGDLDDNCRVNLHDFQILASAWLSGHTLADLQFMTANWLTDCRLTPSDPACIPE